MKLLNVAPCAPAGLALALLLSGAAHALPVTATGSIALDGVPATGSPYSDGGGAATSADIIPFRSDSSGNQGFIHSYANSAGVVGSRSSGLGDYAVVGEGKYQLTVENTSAIAQAVYFDFYIDGGEVRASGGASATASASFDALISFGGVSKFATGASTGLAGLTSSMSTTGVDIGYSGTTGVGYSWSGYSDTILLGVLGAGESALLDYTITTLASGASPGTCTTGGPGGGDDIGDGVARAVLVLADDAVEDGVFGDCTSSIARAGDPNNVFMHALGQQPQIITPGVPSRPGSSIRLANVPVPLPATLLLLGVGLVGLRYRLRRQD